MENKKKKMDIVTKMSIVGGLGLACILILVSIISFAIKDKAVNKNNNNKQNETIETEVESQEDAEYIRTLAMIKEVDTENNTLKVVDIDQGGSITLSIDGAVDIKDEYGTLLTLAQLDIGDIIETKYDKNTLRPENVQITGQTWERKNIQNLIYNKENKTIQVGNDIFKYTDDLVILYGGEPISFDKLDPVDQVSVKGYKDTIWNINLEKSHGTIKLKNHEKFVGGTIELGKATEEVKEDTEVKVLVGVQNIVIAKEGMTSFITQVIVEEGKEVLIDVGSALPTAGNVSFTVMPADVKLYINNKLYSDLSKPITLDFGTYDIRVEKENYVPYESQLVVNQAFMAVEINMNKNPMYIHVDQPAGCELYIDSNYIGIIPINTPIDEGPHSITIRKDGYYSKMHSIQVDDTGKDVYFTFPDLIAMPTESPTTTP
jgi:hypothetical protein